MQISSDLIQRAHLKVTETISKIEHIYNIKFDKQVQVKFDINSARLAGQAIYSTNTIRINPHFLVKYPEETINTTIPHEIAHLGIHQFYRIKHHRLVTAHGPEWKQMMISIGADPSRTHSMEADEGIGRRKTKYGYKCSTCGKPIPVGPKIHANIQQGQLYMPRCCGKSARLIYVGNVGAVSNVQASLMISNNQVADTPTQKQPIGKLPDPNSKLGKCYAIYLKNKDKNWSRQTWIAIFAKDAGCTSAGASTYLSNIKKMFQ